MGLQAIAMEEGKACLFADSFFKKQWMTISDGLRKVSESSDSASLRSHLQAISSDANFHATRAGKPDFEAVLDYIPESKDFFSRILPKIVRLAEAALSFERIDVQLLVQGVSDGVFLTYPEVATILALAFLGLLPNGASMSPLYFPKDGCAFPPNTEKLRCFLSYFDQISEKACDEQGIRVSRIVRSEQMTLKDLETNACRLCKMRLQDLRQPIYESKAPLHVDFANASVGGGIFLNAPGATAQEEITFATHPELCIATILCDVLQDNEAVLIHGARHFCRHVGFLDTFAFLENVPPDDPDFFSDAMQVVIDARMYDGGGIGRPYRYDHKCLAKMNMWRIFPSWAKRNLNNVDIVMSPLLHPFDLRLYSCLDFISLSKLPQKAFRFQVDDCQRDLQKAFYGFAGAVDVGHRTAATGNWGCGAFGGSSAVKVFLQWIAASLAGLEALEYFPWDDLILHQLLEFLWLKGCEGIMNACWEFSGTKCP